MTFYNRESELEFLNNQFETEGFDLIVIYGRRRVGKTELIRQFCSDKNSLYHLFSSDTSKMQRERLVERIASKFDERTPQTENWRDVVEYIGEKLNENDIVVALDEFQYIIESDKSSVSHFQYLVDIIVENPDSMLILSGSTVSIIENKVLGYDSPLYGRRTGQLDLKPLSFRDSMKAIDYSFEDSVKSFTVTGGTPLYLTAFDYKKDLKENIREKILNPGSMLFEEPEFLLRQELREPSRYMSILESIANGYKTPNEISNNTGIQSTTLTQYLNRLKKLRMIEKQKPITASKKSKRSIYVIKDNFLRFWFQNIAPMKSDIEEDHERAIGAISDNLKHQYSRTFEQICRELIRKQKEYPEIGKWWYKEDEIDIAALNEDEEKLLLGECKWTKEKVGIKLLRDLEEKEQKVRWKNSKRETEYMLFSKAGFKQELQKEADKREDLRLYDIKDLEEDLSE